MDSEKHTIESRQPISTEDPQTNVPGIVEGGDEKGPTKEDTTTTQANSPGDATLEFPVFVPEPACVLSMMSRLVLGTDPSSYKMENTQKVSTFPPYSILLSCL